MPRRSYPFWLHSHRVAGIRRSAPAGTLHGLCARPRHAGRTRQHLWRARRPRRARRRDSPPRSTGALPRRRSPGTRRPARRRAGPGARPLEPGFAGLERARRAREPGGRRGPRGGQSGHAARRPGGAAGGGRARRGAAASLAARLAPRPRARDTRAAGRGRGARRGGQPRRGGCTRGDTHGPPDRRRARGRRQRGGGGSDRDLELASGDPGGGARGAADSHVKRLVCGWLACWLAGAACRSPTIPEASRFPAGTGFTARHITLDGTSLRYIDEGRGPPIVFLHGLGASMYAWRKNLAPVAAAGYRVIAFDNRGFGFSGKPATGYDNASYARLTVALLDALHLPDAVLIGHSMGGAIAAEVAIAHPERVRGLVLIGSAGLGAREPPLFRVGRWPLVGPLLFAFRGRGLTERLLKATYADPRQVSDADVDQYYAPVRSGAIAAEVAIALPGRVRGLVLIGSAGLGAREPPLFRVGRWPLVGPLLFAFRGRGLTERLLKATYADPRKVSDADVDQYYAPVAEPEYGRSLRAVLREFRFDGLAGRLDHIAAPTLVLWGEADRLIPITLGRALAAGIPRAAFLSVPGAGHAVQEEAPDEVNRLLIGFLKDGLPRIPGDLAPGGRDRIFHQPFG